jgi:excisionase family DNA binding protein
MKDSFNVYDLLDQWFPGCGWGTQRFRVIDAECNGDGYYDLREAAEYLGFTLERLKNLCRDKRITHARIDYRTYRFKRIALDAYLTQFTKRRKDGF